MADTKSVVREETPNVVTERAKKVLHEGCGCLRGSKGGPCSREFREETVLFNLNNCLELTSGEFDLIIFANVQAFTCTDYIGTTRNRTSRCTYQFQSVLICKERFLHLYGISYSRLRRLKEHYETHGIYPRTHGNTKRLPSNTLPQSTTENVHNFLTNYAEEKAFVLPGRIRGFKSKDVKVVSSSETKMSVWHVYTATRETREEQSVSYSKFVDLWQQFCPKVVVAKPMTNLCFTCQQNTTKLVRAANLPEHEKADYIRAQQEHLDCAQTERDFYRQSCLDLAATLSK